MSFWTVILILGYFLYNWLDAQHEKKDAAKTDAERVAEKEAEAEKRRKIAHEIAFGDLHGPHKYS